MFVLTSGFFRLLLFFSSSGIPRIRRRILRCRITSLPDEVLYHIFHHLECGEILAMRLTCWRLYVISKSRLLWHSKVLRLSYSSGVPLLEATIENYTLEELEEKSITRIRNVQKWRTLDPVHFQSRKFLVDYSPRPWYQLKWLPGGRWLLFNQEGCVSIMDLDSQTLTRELLFDVSDPSDPLRHSTIWIDHTKYWLSPRIGLHCWDTGNSEVPSRICVYRLFATGHGSAMKWSAEQMATIRNSARGLKSELQLNEDYVIEKCQHASEGGYIYKAYLYRYSQRQLRSCEWDWEYKSTAVLLPKSRVGFVTLTHIRISAIKLDGPDGLSLEPTFCTLLEPVPGDSMVYQLHSTFHFSYLNIATQGSILQVQFLHDANQVYQKNITFSCGRIFPAIESPSLLVRPWSDSSTDFIFYKLGEGATKQVASQTRIAVNVFPTNPALIACDVTSGRLIAYKFCNHILLQI